MDFTEATDVAVSNDDVATLDKVFVRLWVVETADDGPDSGDRGSDVLDDGRAALVRGDRVVVITRHRFGDCGSA